MRFSYQEQKDMERLLVLKTMVSEQELVDEPCPLLLSQLIELEVFTNKLSDLVCKMKATCELLK